MVIAAVGVLAVIALALLYRTYSPSKRLDSDEQKAQALLPTAVVEIQFAGATLCNGILMTAEKVLIESDCIEKHSILKSSDLKIAFRKRIATWFRKADLLSGFCRFPDPQTEPDFEDCATKSFESFSSLHQPSSLLVANYIDPYDSSPLQFAVVSGQRGDLFAILEFDHGSSAIPSGYIPLGSAKSDVLGKMIRSF